MLFNNLLDLIHINQKCFNTNSCDIINEYICKNSIIDSKPIDDINELKSHIDNLELVLCETIGTYYLKFSNKCDDFNIIKEEMLFNQFCIYTNNYVDTFDVNYELSFYKYMICIIFLDDNSKITFFNNHIIYPSKGDLIIFPCEWFFIYRLESINSDKKNNIILNNIIKRF